MTSAAEAWWFERLGIARPAEGEAVEIGGQTFVLRDGILRSQGLHTSTQQQTADSFGFKWSQRDTFESDASLERMRKWLVERYGDVAAADWWSDYGRDAVLLDAGCGAAMSALELFGPVLERVRYVGVDVSDAVDTARHRFEARGLDGVFLQADVGQLPLPPGSIDVIFSEGVLHHTDSTQRALHSTARLIRPGGRFLFYVYRRKGPIREFTDDYVRERLRGMTPRQAWDALLPVTRLGRQLAELGVDVDVPEDIELLSIPAGRIDLQRLFYWHVFKCFYHPELTIDEMNHINFDWYAPANAHRQTPEQVRIWCADAELEIEREVIEDAGITVVARKLG